MSNIKYIGNNTEKLTKGKIHIKEGNQTGCGFRIDDNPKDWESTSSSVNCEKNGCKDK